jgi:hypothetical protein
MTGVRGGVGMLTDEGPSELAGGSLLKRNVTPVL